MPKTKSPEGFYDVEEAAEALGYSHRNSFLRALHNGTIKLKIHRREAWRTKEKYYFDIAQVSRVAEVRKAVKS